MWPTIWHGLSFYEKQAKWATRVRFLDKIYTESGDYELPLSVAFVFMGENTAKLVAATPNPISKYCCWNAHITSFRQFRMDEAYLPGTKNAVCLGWIQR